MALRLDAPYAGVFRTVYFLAIAAAAVFVVVAAISSFYDPPGGGTIFSSDSSSGDGSFFDEDFQQQIQESERKQDNYNRNISLILSAISAGVYAIAIFGLGSRFNPLRAGTALAALLISFIAIGAWANSSDQWIGLVTSVLVLAVLITGIIALDDGLPLSPRTPPRRLDPSDIAAPPPTEPSPPQPPQTSY